MSSTKPTPPISTKSNSNLLKMLILRVILIRGCSNSTNKKINEITTTKIEIIEAKTGEVVDYWRPSKEQKSAYKKKANAIKKAAKTAAKKPTAKPRAKAPVKKTVAKPKARPSPSQSAAATKVGTRKRGNDGFMWEVKKNKNGVHRWARDTKSTKRAEDYWYWKV